MKRETLVFRILFLSLVAAFLVTLTTCGGGGGSESTGTESPAEGYVVLAWNDLGMHCLNPTYDSAVVLPPYNTLWAQVVQRGDPPRIVTSGIQVDYAIQNNTYSYGKGFFGQFWDNVQALFGTTLNRDTGLNLVDPTVHNGLSGSMVPAGDHFQVDGIPLTPVRDDGLKTPYQVALITVKNSAGTVLVQTQAMAPTSDEITCNKCHSPGETIGGAFAAILQQHDDENGTSLAGSGPVLCAQCHGSPALGQSGRGASGKYLSEAIHGFHAGRQAPGGAAIGCYDCHPGAQTQCSRSLAHTAADGNCVACHGSMAASAAEIAAGTKIPWVDEPKCLDCHSAVQGVDTGAVLYRNAVGHGGVYCAGCHQSPHAMIPSREGTDNYQARQYQGADVSIASCGACHDSSRGAGEGISGFIQEHAGDNPEARSACGICHTALPATIAAAQFPHQFTWKAR